MGDICLESVTETMKKRRTRLGMENDERGSLIVFSLDKGRGRVTSTFSFVHHPRPCSYYNHLPLQVILFIKFTVLYGLTGSTFNT